MYTTDMFEVEDLDDMVDLLEDLDYEEYDEDYDEDDIESDLMERRRGRMRRPRRSVVPKRGLFPRRRSPSKGKYVTQGQLKAAMDRTEKSIKAVNARVTSVSNEQVRQAAALKKETMARKKEVAALKKDFNSKLETLAIIPLLMQPDSVKVSTTEGDKEVLIKSDNTLSTLLPFLLISGGGFGGSSGDSNSSLNSLLPLLIIADVAKPSK